MSSVRYEELREAANRANALTATWCDVTPPGEFVVSGAGVWPLLALLEAGAAGKALDELRAAVGVEPDDASRLSVRLMTHLGSIGVDAALALWIRAGVPINASWATELPASAFDELPRENAAARSAINRWASDVTKGRITDVDVAIDDLTALVLTCALRTSFEWRTPFNMKPVPWLGEEVAGLRNWLPNLHDLGIIDEPNPVARFVTQARGGINVHVLSGAPDASPGEVLRSGIAAVEAPERCLTASALTEERTVNALRLVFRESTGPDATIEMPAFSIRSRHDLLGLAGLFGLETAKNPGDHFPDISRELYVTSASQQAYATFQRTGFEAAALTAIATAPRSIARPPRPPERYLCAEMVVDRPFGFLVVHEPMGLVLFAGWVTTPVQPDESDAVPALRPRG